MAELSAKQHAEIVNLIRDELAKSQSNRPLRAISIATVPLILAAIAIGLWNKDGLLKFLGGVPIVYSATYGQCIQLKDGGLYYCISTDGHTVQTTDFRTIYHTAQF